MNKPIGSQGHPASCYPTEKRKPTISSYLSIVRLVNRKSIAVESYSPHPSGTGVAIPCRSTHMDQAIKCKVLKSKQATSF